MFNALTTSELVTLHQVLHQGQVAQGFDNGMYDEIRDVRMDVRAADLWPVVINGHNVYAEPPAGLFERPRSDAPERKSVVCANCFRPLHRQRNGAWYHTHNASVSCWPGDGSPKRAEPQEVA